MMQYPLISRDDFDETWIYTTKAQLNVGEVLYQAKKVSDQLSGHRYCLLLCEQRVNFIIGFLAALWAGKTVLLPPNRSQGVVDSLLNDYPDSYVINDGGDSNKGEGGAETVVIQHERAETGFLTDIPLIDSSHLACLVFTSGSTGKPAANAKFWGDLIKGTELIRECYGFSGGEYIIATVPAQHMYGLETTVLLPMICPVSVFGGTPFFPDDIRQAMLLSAKPACLISTPLHLRVCVQTNIRWPKAQRIISATSPLSAGDAEKAEHCFSAQLMEIYGSTETGAIASRRTVCSKVWTLYDTVSLGCSKEGISERDQVRVIARHLPHQPVLNDEIEIVDDNHFLMHGRSTDMVKIAGKRASLADLNLKLNAIFGVEDGVFIQEELSTGKVSRLCAVIVAPNVSTSDIIRVLRAKIDPVFLPRPVYKVAKLPRNEMGKLPQAEMMKLLQQLVLE